jgi:lysophospholipase L1-like esterase
LKRVVATLFMVILGAPQALAQTNSACSLPGYLMLVESPLHRVAAAVNTKQQLKVAVVGTGSSQLAGVDGRNYSYPARLEAALKRRLPGVAVTVVPFAKPRQTAAEMSKALEKMLVDEKPTLVVWQTGTFDAMRGVDPGEFRETVAAGVEKLQAAGADVILVNMQYSPRTETILATGGYADSLRWVSREREVPLFDRLGLMRYWNDTGEIDLYGGTKDAMAAKRVHDCIGRALASMIIEGASLEPLEGKASQ